MNSLIWLGCVSFALSLILTPIFRDVFRSYGVVDQPDGGRKIHKYPIPRVGGIAIACSYVGCFFVVPLLSKNPFEDKLSLFWNVLPAFGVIFAVGVIDDLFGLKPWQKLFGQLAAAGLAYWAGVRVVDVVGLHAESWWSLPVTILWLLTCTNAFNLVDGMDGLAAGVGLFATLTIFLAAILHGNTPLAMATFPLAACLLGFLCYNFNPATIFLGDSGSLLIGFLLGCFGVVWTQKSATFLGMTAPLMALSIPLVDVGLAVLRRVLKRQPIFSADRGHIHHRLLDRGLTPRHAVLILYGTCSLVAAFSLAANMVEKDNRLSAFVIILFCVMAWVGIQYLRYDEFSVAGRMLLRGDFQRTLKAKLDLNAFERHLSRAKTVAEFWKYTVEAAPKFGFFCTRMETPGERFDSAASGGLLEESWTCRIPIASAGFIELARNRECAGLAVMAGPFLDMVQTGIEKRFRELSAETPGAPVSVSNLTASEGVG
jgi:UDP-GlcNAc:undecaprenyl-phosphate/decaprenyl-phosphate GlcNAc-1-phosphate transferase